MVALDHVGDSRVSVLGFGGRGDQFLLLAGRFIAALEQQTDCDEAREQGRAALAHEGKGNAGHRQKLRDAGDDQEGLEGDCGCQAGCHECRVIGFSACSGRKASDREQHVGDEDCGGAEQAHLFADCGEDEVALDDRDVVGKTASDTGTDQAAVS